MKTIQQFAKLIHLATDDQSRETLVELYRAIKADFEVYKQNSALIGRIVADVADAKAVYLSVQPEIAATVHAFSDTEVLLQELGVKL